MVVILFSATLRRLARDTRAQDLVDYALIAAMIATATAASLTDVAVNINALFEKLSKLMAIAKP